MDLSIQNTEKSLQLLSAQDRLYAGAKTYVYFIFILSVLPLLGWILRIYYPISDDAIAATGLAVLVLSLIADQLVKGKIEKAARIQEEFDMDVFKLSWNEGLVGERVSKELRLKAAGSFKIQPHRLPWYTEAIGTLPASNLQILLCQRESVMWDLQLKQQVSRILSWILIISLFALIIWGYAVNSSFREWFKIALLPASGFLVENWKLYRNFSTVGNIQEDLNQSIEAEIEAFKKNKATISDERLRLFQDKIYHYRKENCLVPGIIYTALQKGFQSRTTKATIEYINELKA